MQKPDVTWLNGLLACDDCGTTLEPSDRVPQMQCPKCGNHWQTDGLTLTAQHMSSLDGLDKTSQAFFDTHSLTKSNPVILESYIDKIYKLANFDYVGYASALAIKLDSISIVEIGCGDGRTINALRKNQPNRNIIGIDVSSEKLSEAAYESLMSPPQSRDASVAFVQCQGPRVPLVSEMADLVLLLHVLHHTEGLLLVDESARILKPGGTLLIVDISSRNPFNLAIRTLWFFLPSFIRKFFNQEYMIDCQAPPVRLVSPTSLAKKAQLAGLQAGLIEDDGLFAFLLVYLILIVPFLQKHYIMIFFAQLRRFERFLIRVTPAHHFTIGLIRTYQKNIKS